MTIKPKGYGELTNLIRFEQVYMVSHHEGVGTDDSPHREVKTFFSREGEFLGRIDPLKVHKSV